jgi:hypothetical protein
MVLIRCRSAVYPFYKCVFRKHAVAIITMSEFQYREKIGYAVHNAKREADLYRKL